MACVFLCHLPVNSPFLFRPNVLPIKLVGQKSIALSFALSFSFGLYFCFEPSLPVVEVYFIPPTGFNKGWI